MKEEKEFGSWSQSSQTWSGAMGLIVNNEVDLVVSDLSLTPQRLNSADFSMPLFSTQDTLYVKKPSNKKAIIWTGYFEPFNFEIWVVFLLLIITTPLLLTLMKNKLSKTSPSLPILTSECYFNVWRIYCQQGLQGICKQKKFFFVFNSLILICNILEFPAKSSIRLAYFSIFLCSFIVMSVYSASLISYLTIPTSNLPFSTLESFVQDGSYKLIVIKDGSEYDIFRVYMF